MSFFRKIGRQLFSERSYERAERVDKYMKPVGNIFGSLGKVLGGVSAVYALGWARNRYLNERLERRRSEEEEDAIRKLLEDYLQK